LAKSIFFKKTKTKTMLAGSQAIEECVAQCCVATSTGRASVAALPPYADTKNERFEVSHHRQQLSFVEELP
jgi:hypothetical protein